MTSSRADGDEGCAFLVCLWHTPLRRYGELQRSTMAIGKRLMAVPRYSSAFPVAGGMNAHANSLLLSVCLISGPQGNIHGLPFWRRPSGHELRPTVAAGSSSSASCLLALLTDSSACGPSHFMGCKVVTDSACRLTLCSAWPSWQTLPTLSRDGTLACCATASSSLQH